MNNRIIIGIFIYFLCCPFLISGVVAQTNSYCGTEMPQDMMNWLKDYKMNQGSRALKTAGNDIDYIPLKLHVVGNDAGGGYHKTQHLLDAICHLNTQYEQVGFHFYIYGDINYINSTDLYEHTSSSSITSLILNSKVSNVANLYFVSDPAGACGYFSGWTDFIALRNSCAGPTNSTIAHELGHYFSLPHTFYGWENRNPNTANARASDERVNGTNCQSAGDHFCDTPADYISDRWNCPYNQTKVDYVGDPYEVDGSLFMSYANDACQDRFSVEQIDAMHAYLANNRSYLLNHPLPLIAEVANTQTVYPKNGARGIPANYVNLKWRKVEGATHYSLLVTKYISGAFFDIDLITQDTSIILTDLQPGYTFRWKVKPINAANTCADYTNYSNFITTDETAIIPAPSVTPETCLGAQDGQIAIGASGGTGPYDFNWSTGDSSLFISNLAAGNYLLTITDNNGDSLVLSYDIAAPNPIDAEVTLTNFSIKTEVSGGTPPYNYSWSTGDNNPQISVSGNGEYSVTVTDNHACSIVRTIEVTDFATAINEQSFNNHQVRIYPNPASKGNFITVELQSEKAFSGGIEVFNYAGKRMFNINKSFNAGVTAEQIDISELNAGIYVVRILTETANINNKLVIF